MFRGGRKGHFSLFHVFLLLLLVILSGTQFSGVCGRIKVRKLIHGALRYGVYKMGEVPWEGAGRQSPPLVVPRLPGGGGPLQDGLTPALSLGTKEINQKPARTLNPLECEQNKAEMNHKMCPSFSRIPLLAQPWPGSPAQPRFKEACPGPRWP